MKKVSDILPYFIQELGSSYMDKREIISISYIVIEYYFKFTRSEIIFYNNNLNQDQILQLNKVIDELKKGKPIQYILSETFFYNSRIYLNNKVLIPRSETEELVDWIIKDNQGSNKRYLDIGTGSACIIIALAKELEGKFEGIDISKDALEIAEKNCLQYDLDIDLKKLDIIQDTLSSKWDVIVSNPPYVLESEKEYMDPNIFYEPEISLFVNDNNPLLYYKRIAHQATNCLNNKGLLYFEINEKFGSQITHILSEEGFVNIELKKDINDKDRMIKAIWK